jgi:hypothetical protein
MNPTEQSGCDTCEQPVLTWNELRALAGLSLIAFILFIGIASQAPEGQSAATNAALESQAPLPENLPPATDVLLVDTPPLEIPFSESTTTPPEAL